MTKFSLKSIFCKELSTLGLEEREILSLVRIYALDELNRKSVSLNKPLDEAELEMVYKDLARLKSNEPIQYITQIAWFYGLKLFVDENVLIPRPETEELVDWIRQDHKWNDDKLEILDIGTGSGCIALALKKHLSDSIVEGWDISSGALDVASYNAKQLDLKIELKKVDMLSDIDKLPAKKRNIIVSNPPYIPPSERIEMSKSTQRFEPELALFVEEEDPALFYGRIAEYAGKCLSSDGALYFELNEFHAEEIRDKLLGYGFSKVSIRKDLQGKDRMLKAMFG